GPAIPAQHRHRGERLSRESPATQLVAHRRQRVHHRVEVGAHVQTQMLEVVARVDDRGERPARQLTGEAVEETTAADTTRERNHPLELHASLPPFATLISGRAAYE